MRGSKKSGVAGNVLRGTEDFLIKPQPSLWNLIPYPLHLLVIAIVFLIVLNFFVLDFSMTILTGRPLSWAISATAGSGFLL